MAEPARRAAVADRHGARDGPGHRPADRAVARTPRPRRLPRDQRLQRRPRGADVRPARAAGRRRLAGHAVVRSLRTRRPGDPDRAHPLRAAADHHQRLRRRAGGVSGRARVGPRHGHDRPAAVLPGRAAAGDAAGDVGHSPRPRAGVGHGHHRRTGGRTGPGSGHHRRLLPVQLRQGHRRRHRRGPGRPRPRAAWPPWSQRLLDPTRRGGASPNREVGMSVATSTVDEAADAVG